MTYLIVTAVALVMAAASTAWPVDANVSVISNGLLMPGRFWNTVFMLAVYTLAQMWPLIILAVVFSRLPMTVRLRHMVMAAVFLAAGTAVIYVFGGL